MFILGRQIEKGTLTMEDEMSSIDDISVKRGEEALAGDMAWTLTTDGGFELELSCVGAAADQCGGGIREAGDASGLNGGVGKKRPEVERKLEIGTDGDTAAVVFHAFQPPCEPFFGAQPYLDAKEGASYSVKLKGAERFMAVYQHKDWWIRPAFPALLSEVPERTQLLLAGNEKDRKSVV